MSHKILVLGSRKTTFKWTRCLVTFVFKDIMCKTNSHTLEELRNKIRHEISTISGEELQRVNNNVFCRYAEFIRSGG
jgi:hypothetical protein